MPNVAPKKKEEVQDDIQSLIERNSCGICRANKLPICTGHGAGKGGGESGSSGNDAVEKQAKEPEKNEITKQIQYAKENTPGDLIIDEELAAQSSAMNPFDLEKMLDLLLINNDSERGVLTIRPKPNLCLSLDDEKQVQEFIRAIKLVFDQFKIALEKRGISVDGFTATTNKNELKIRIPSPKYFDAFVQQLVSSNLLPKTYAPELEQQKNKSAQFTPLAMTPSFQGKKDEGKDEEEKAAEYESKENKGFNPSPFSFSLKNIGVGGRS
jgi:hypothetical protein